MTTSGKQSPIQWMVRATGVFTYIYTKGLLAEVKMVDLILSQDNQEFEALVSSMQDHAGEEDQHQQETLSDYGSDEEEYDQLFMEIMSRQGSAEERTDINGEGVAEQDQDMDLSLG